MVGDSLIAVHLLLIDVAILLFTRFEEAPDFAPWYVALPVDVLTVLPLVVRRRYPLVSAYGVLVLGAAHAALQLGLASGIASAVSVYSVVIYAGRAHGVLYLVLMVVASATQILLQYDDGRVINAVVVALVLALCWMLGEFVGARRAYHAEVEARLHLLETERDQATRIAVAEERGRIARELHDVVAHAVSVIVVHADGASYAIRTDPGLAERAVRTISDTGRGALAELRRLLDVLRGEGGGSEPRVPQPTAADLAEVADAMRAAGLPVLLDVDGDLGELPAGVSLGVYRIVQESLTNTLKHAGPGARAEVCVRRGDDEVTVTVTDDGAGRARQVAGTRAPEPGGNGLIGMRERAHVYGGTLDAGPSPGGGWHVRARLPVRLEP
ncbi:two-component sensor histidine kinase [Prauserella muralis]|uniref:histidine kinase n=2 Tax=Prauserella muralis TaxID=588067 RepID=A0A2V4BC23_9PSEU|nr:sensor histidine kinase [Prauserella muralis]PXY31599.1 two-component sensor histidine kinase [Prauserella muralis]